MKRSIFILFALCFITIAPYANAQISIGQSDVEVSIYPESPRANENISASIVSYITDINSASITWRVNGKVIASGIGEKSASFMSGDIGVTTNLSVTVLTKEGQTIQKNIPIKPGSVDLIWQSDSYTPPFYKGKALFSAQNTVTFIAIPHIAGTNGVEISPKNLLYTWSQNGSVKENQSGYGKNTFTFTQSVIARPVEVTVKVTSGRDGEVAFERVVLAPTEPMVLFYKRNPIYGIEFQNAIRGTLDLNDSKEITVVAIPFYFGTTHPNDSVSYKWSINGKRIDDDTTQTSRVFRQPEGQSGTSNISISIEHGSKILQLATNNFNLKYGAVETSQNAF